ncbi:DMT family transporter [Caviibacterium pharyngocola]|uniref:EamA family transporter n=1 Tax=Caviibacterium pharyngocola TaxID=28159 RepID=A0A2M8RWJ5_9PAST|nr:DMT family transporter [Caviibacterium pharyngocola]PJG83270.1 EamA family transporter [Caviibacterium pharyngocola]
MQKYLGETILLFVTVIAAIGWFFSKYAIAEMPPVGFLGLRFSLAALLFLPFAYPQLKALSASQRIACASVGIMFTLDLAFWIIAIHYSTQFGEGAFIFSLSMLIAPLIGWILFKQKPAALFWIALPIATCGLYLLSAAQGELHFSLSTVLYLCAALSAAVYFVLNNQYAKSVSPLPLTTIQLACVGTLCGIYSLLTEDWSRSISVETWLWFGASVLIATNFRFFLQTLGQRYCNITVAAIIMTLEPVWTLGLSIWLLDEILTWQKGLGCLLILTALLVYRLKSFLK